jgi:hypothetical protein
VPFYTDLLKSLNAHQLNAKEVLQHLDGTSGRPLRLRRFRWSVGT